jgi:hypothetical protein
VISRTPRAKHKNPVTKNQKKKKKKKKKPKNLCVRGKLLVWWQEANLGGLER